ncbi:Arc family DNA-binding protein [Aureimonas flava]|uniref:Arc family DNA-binding protein n=1 Tax=Aureimonas flava TaxID=2320271 RepID=A0A3A1WKT9_9HYPH|nr:Arc family DNA-binding protein [Aureimonas flava]RIY00869.1 Arc family DNA-binding protein [Aureimonas flava]
MARGDYPSAKQDQYMLRFPDGMRERLKHEAEMNGRSLNAEIIYRLTGTIEADDESRSTARGVYDIHLKLPGSVRDRIYAAAEENERTLTGEIIYTLEREYPDLAPLGDILDIINFSLERAKRKGDARSHYELELALERVREFYRHSSDDGSAGPS